MSLRFFWGCEDTTLSGTDDFTAGDSTATVQGTVSIDAAAALVGSNGILVGAGNSHYRFDNTAGASQIVNRSAAAVGFWFRVDTNPSGLAPLFMARGVSANDYYAFYINNLFNSGGGIARLQYRSTDTGGGTTQNLICTGTGLSEDTTYFAIIAWDQPNSLTGIWVYDSGGSLLQSATSSSAFVAPLDLNLNTGLRIGESAGQSITCHIDNVFIGDAYDDKDTFLTNRSITSYTAYGGGGDPAPSITDVDGGSTIALQKTGAVLTGTNINNASLEIRLGGFVYPLTINSQNSTTVNFDMIEIGAEGPIFAPHSGAAVLALINEDEQEATFNITIEDDAGTETYLIGTPNADAGLRLTGSDDAESGDYVRISNVQGGSITDVDVENDLTFETDGSVTAFDDQFWDADDGTYGDRATQTVGSLVIVPAAGRARDARRVGFTRSFSLSIRRGRG